MRRVGRSARRRFRIDQAFSLPMPALERAGVFDPGPGERSWLCAWRSDTTMVSSVRVQWPADAVMSSGLRLASSTLEADGLWVPREYRIPVYPGAGRGGRGRSFLCPLVSHGKNCFRRCRVLYRPPNSESFGCRQCHRLIAARRRPSKALTDPAAELATAEQDVIQAVALTALQPAVERLAAAREAMADLLHAELRKAAQVEALITEAGAALRDPQAKVQKLMRCATKLRRARKDDERALLDHFDQGLPGPDALRFEVSLWAATRS
jgi:hypothetical protein